MNARWIKRIVLGVLAIVGLAGGATAIMLIRAGGEGEVALERWIGGQLKRIVNDYLNPTLDFDMLDYQYPKTVVVTGMRLEADDPATPGAVIRVMQAERVRIELAAIPKRGEPIVIQSIEADAPVLRLIAAGPESPFKLVGLSDVVKQRDTDKPGRTNGEPIALSDVFQMNLVSLRDGVVEYDPRQPDHPPMRLDGFTTQMTCEKDDKGWYVFAFDMSRPPVFTFKSTGRVNLDDARLALHDTSLALDLGSEDVAALPPQVQKLLRDHEVDGHLTAQVAGEIPFSDPGAAELLAKVRMTGASVAFDEYRLPVERLSADMDVKDGHAIVNPVTVELLGGRIDADADITLNETLDAEGRLKLENIRLEEAVRPVSANGSAESEPKMAGRIKGDIEFALPLTAAATQAGGHGRITLEQGRLGAVPGVDEINEGLEAATEAIGHDRNAPPGDVVDMIFELRGDHAYLQEMQIITTSLDMLGKGKVGFDGQLRMEFTGGPVKRLGIIGELIAEAADNIRRYDVRGTVDEPVVTLAIAGAPTERPPDPETPRETPASDLFRDFRRSVAGQPDEEEKTEEEEEEEFFNRRW